MLLNRLDVRVLLPISFRRCLTHFSRSGSDLNRLVMPLRRYWDLVHPLVVAMFD
jgi:hypothetical protein